MFRRLVFLDIDGTLTLPGSNVPPASALSAIKAARKAGNGVFLCSGRNYGMLKPLLSYGFDGFIASGGGYIEAAGRVVYDCPMTEAQRALTFSVFQESGVFRTVECRDDSYTDEGFKEFLENNAQAKGNSELLRWRKQIEGALNIRPMREYGGEPVYKLVFMCDAEEKLDAPKKALSGEFHFVVQEKDKYGIVNGELVNRKFDKGKGVLCVCKALGIDVKDTCGFGDSMNDLEMLETVGVSVCMENGSERLKALADEVCPAVDKDGLSAAFYRLGLCEA